MHVVVLDERRNLEVWAQDDTRWEQCRKKTLSTHSTDERYEHRAYLHSARSKIGSQPKQGKNKRADRKKKHQIKKWNTHSIG